MKIKNNIIEIMIAVGVLLLLINSSDPIILPDTSRYLKSSLLDPPMYSSIITIMNSLFGSLKSVVIFQTLLIGFSIIFFIRTVSTILNLNNIIKFLVSLILFLPTIKFYNNLLTEPISYAFSILFVSCIIKTIYNFNIQNLIWGTFFAVALLLTRNQFMFLYPVIFLVFLGVFFVERSNKIKKWLILSFIGVFMFHNSIIFLNTYLNKDSVEKDYFITTSDDWIQSLTYVSLGPSYFVYIDAIYISNLEDIKLFEDQNLQKTLSAIFIEMNNRKSLVEFYDGRGHFGKSLADIRDYSNPLLLKLANQNNTTIDKLKREISLKLIMANFDKYIKQIFKKFYDSTWLFIFIPCIMLLSSLISFLKHKSHFSLITLFISTFVLGNHSVVYLFGRVQPRYLIYSDFILLAFILIIFSIFFQKKYL